MIEKLTKWSYIEDNKFIVKHLTREEILEKFDISKKYSYVYKITNKINNMFYIGVHKGILEHNITCVLSSNHSSYYFGSSVNIKFLRHKERYGLENFSIDLIDAFDDNIDAYNCESLIITRDIIKSFVNKQIYNMSPGGNGSGFGYINEDNKYIYPQNNHSYYYHKDDMSIRKKHYLLSPNDPRVLSGEFINKSSGKSRYYHKDDLNMTIVELRSDDPRVLSGDFINISTGKSRYKDKEGKIVTLSVNDSKVLSGEVVGLNSGKANYFIRDTNTIIQCNTDDPRVLSGELISSSLGRKFINNGKENRLVYLKELNTYLDNGWKLGQVKVTKLMKCPYCGFSNNNKNGCMTLRHFENCKNKP